MVLGQEVSKVALSQAGRKRKRNVASKSLYFQPAGVVCEDPGLFSGVLQLEAAALGQWVLTTARAKQQLKVVSDFYLLPPKTP